MAPGGNLPGRRLLIAERLDPSWAARLERTAARRRASDEDISVEKARTPLALRARRRFWRRGH
jgi:hypothetical protein